MGTVDGGTPEMGGRPASGSAEERGLGGVKTLVAGGSLMTSSIPYFGKPAVAINFS